MLRTDWVSTWNEWPAVGAQLRSATSAPARQKIVQRFLERLRTLLAQNADARIASDAKRLQDLSAEGRTMGTGRIFGENNCLAVSLLQVKALAGLLPAEVATDLRRRRTLSAAARAALNREPAHLRPRALDARGVPRHVSAEEHRTAFLQAEVHSAFLFGFFQQRLGAPPPHAEVRLRVYTRWDSAAFPPVEVQLFDPPPQRMNWKALRLLAR